MIRLAPVSLLVAVFVAGAHIAAAQPIGTFRWQQQPYCNVLTLNVVQQGAVFQLDGYDDLCGAAHRGAASGLAFLNPDGSLGLGVTIVHSGGLTTHLDAVMSLSSVSGQWRDGHGGAGAWTFTPGAPSPGSPRPVARAVFAAGLSAGGATLSNLGSPLAATDAANRQYVDTGITTAVATSRQLTAGGDWVTGDSAGYIEIGAAPLQRPGNGCLVYVATSALVEFSLTVPVGARPTSVMVRGVAPAPTSFDVRLNRVSWPEVGATNYADVLVLPQQDLPMTAVFGVASVPLPPQPPSTPGDVYRLRVSGANHFEPMQLCNVRLGYEAP